MFTSQLLTRLQESTWHQSSCFTCSGVCWHQLPRGLLYWFDWLQINTWDSEHSDRDSEKCIWRPWMFILSQFALDEDKNVLERFVVKKLWWTVLLGLWRCHLWCLITASHNWSITQERLCQTERCDCWGEHSHHYCSQCCSTHSTFTKVIKLLNSNCL